MRFVDLFAGIGGFHLALTSLGHECVFASELDPTLRHLYSDNFHFPDHLIEGDIRLAKYDVPEHDILCAGFPCQPFSKSGNQFGLLDKTRGTLFHELIEITKQREPSYLILENVGNFERHDCGRTWEIVRQSLIDLKYEVSGTVHVTSGGHGLISPHHLGHPQTRERFFIVASKFPILIDPFPPRDRAQATSLAAIETPDDDLSEADKRETALPPHYVSCIEHWNEFLARIPQHVDLPSFPIWGDEFGASYPFEDRTPAALSRDELMAVLDMEFATFLSRAELLDLLPQYATARGSRFPDWKIAFIRKNRDWFSSISRYISKDWLAKLQNFPPSLRKLEWNCKGEERNLWRHVLQFRPSGLRVKRYSSSPALVSMTVSQIPILGPKRRFITRGEGLRIQGFPSTLALPQARDDAFKALGNAVHVEVVRAIAQRLLPREDRSAPTNDNLRPGQVQLRSVA